MERDWMMMRTIKMAALTGVAFSALSLSAAEPELYVWERSGHDGGFFMLAVPDELGAFELGCSGGELLDVYGDQSGRDLPLVGGFYRVEAGERVAILVNGKRVESVKAGTAGDEAFAQCLYWILKNRELRTMANNGIITIDEYVALVDDMPKRKEAL